MSQGGAFKKLFTISEKKLNYSSFGTIFNNLSA